MSNDHEMGFGKPPKEFRFRKGISGNPKGRPRGSLNKRTLLSRALKEKIVITENGIRKRVTKHEAVYKQLVNKSVAGDLRAMVEIIRLDSQFDLETSKPSEEMLQRVDQDILEGVLERMKQCTQPEDDQK